MNHKVLEWKASRAAIARLQKTVTDLRKYGFILVTALITAKALLYLYLPPPQQVQAGETQTQQGQSQQAEPLESFMAVQTRIATAMFSMILIFSLFVVDRYHEVLLWAAANRAMELEKELGIELTTIMQKAIDQSFVHSWGIWLYSLFVWGSCSSSVLTPLTIEHLIHPHNDSFHCLIFMAAMLFLGAATWYVGYWYHSKTKRRLG
jgi:hypothetical protein